MRLSLLQISLALAAVAGARIFSMSLHVLTDPRFLPQVVSDLTFLNLLLLALEVVDDQFKLQGAEPHTMKPGCYWSGTAPFCAGSCDRGYRQCASSGTGDGKTCVTGYKQQCCKGDCPDDKLSIGKFLLARKCNWSIFSQVSQPFHILFNQEVVILLSIFANTCWNFSLNSYLTRFSAGSFLKTLSKLSPLPKPHIEMLTIIC